MIKYYHSALYTCVTVCAFTCAGSVFCIDVIFYPTDRSDPIGLNGLFFCVQCYNSVSSVLIKT